MERTTAVSFNYKMAIPLTDPSSTIGLMPVTSASSWIANISGFRNCAWSLSFNAGADVVSGSSKICDLSNLKRPKDHQESVDAPRPTHKAYMRCTEVHDL